MESTLQGHGESYHLNQLVTRNSVSGNCRCKTAASAVGSGLMGNFSAGRRITGGLAHRQNRTHTCGCLPRADRPTEKDIINMVESASSNFSKMKEPIIWECQMVGFEIQCLIVTSCNLEKS